jgi:UDP-glucose 4-epimerase
VKVLVTGGAGFIGSHVTHLLAGRGHHVTVLDNLTTGRLDTLTGTTYRLVRGDILDQELLNRYTADVETVVHLAALTSAPASLTRPQAVHEVNTTGTVHILTAARRNHAHVVFASSAAVYGHLDQHPACENLPCRPVSPYGASKAAAEAYLSAYAAAYTLPVLALRLFNVYGPRQPHAGYAAVVAAFITAALAGRPLVVDGDGRQTRDLIHVATVAAVIADAVERRVTDQSPVNVGTGCPVTVENLARRVGGTVGAVRVEHGPARAGDVHDSVADTSRFRAVFPAVTPLPLADGLAETVAWYREWTT